MNRVKSIWVSYAALLILAATTSKSPAAVDSSMQETTNTDAIVLPAEHWAEWKEVNARFWFSSFDTYYNCRTLAKKFETLLIHYGARDDVKVRAGGCNSMSRVDNTISIRANFAVPQMVDLTSQVAGESDADNGPFKVASTEKRIKDIERRTIANNECVVVKHFRDHLLKEFGHEITHDIRSCISGHPNTGARSFSAITASLIANESE